jgi:glucoamylase
MLPEQIWDEADLPAEGMYRGRSAGAAQPLAWAHSEYLKLLRSLADGEVFDRIPLVAERYAVAQEKRTFTNHRQIYSAGRPARNVQAGHTLRIVDAERFRVVYTTDNWATVQEANSKLVSQWAAYVDIFIQSDQRGKIIFTQAWPQDGKPDRWLGRNVEIEILPVPDQPVG